MVWLVLASVCCGFAAAFAYGDLVRLIRTRRARAAVSGYLGTGSNGFGSERFDRRREAAARKRASVQADVHVAEMIDSVALGMRAGLSFDRAFGLYCTRFDDVLSRRCHEALMSWETGLVDRAEALKLLADGFDLPILHQFVGNVLRSLKYGSPVTQTLDELATQARGEYRSRMEEAVAKAPVKMLVPTAGLILPAMLILVMGPVLLEFV